MSFDLVGIFGAGLLTILTPCVLPLVPIYLSALIGADIRGVSGGRRGQLVFRAILFAVGFILVFTLLGLTASSVGAFLVAHKSILQAVGALVILVFGLKFLGVINIAWLDRIVRVDDRKLQTRFGGANAIIMGVLFAAGWSPCAGPVLGSVLTYTASTTSDPLAGATYLAIYGLGFALPLLLIAAFAEAGSRLLDRIGPHLAKIERGIGILMVLVAGSLVFDLANQQASEVSEAGSVEELGVGEEGDRKPTMLVFNSSQCGVCQRMRPMMEGIIKLCHGKGVLIKEFDLSNPSHHHLVSKYRLVGTPTFVFLDDSGNQVARLVGEQTESTLKQALSALRGEPCPGLELLSRVPHGEISGIPCPTSTTESEIAELSCQDPS